ncbi:glycosyltransferase family 4 protein [Nakamurella sp. GG22]
MIDALLDGTPLLGRRTGIGRYTENLLAALAARADVAPRVTAFTARGWRSLPSSVPPGVRTRAVPVPARALRFVWSHAELPPVTLFGGRADVFHGTNFVLPPTGRAGGVMTIHDLAYLANPDTVDRTSRALVDLVPRGLRRAAVVCTPTRVVAEQVRDAYGPSVPELIVTPLGVDEHWFTPDPAATGRIPLPDDYFLFVGTREPRKDLATLLAAYRLLRADLGDAAPALLLVGPEGWGPQEAPEPGVVVMDYLSQPDLRWVTAGARTLVMPSRDEGFGLPALEALACGTPVIVSDVPALLEVTGGMAEVFPIGDAVALAGLLAAAAGSDPAAASAARTAYARAWTWGACAEATVRAYRLAVS